MNKVDKCTFCKKSIVVDIDLQNFIIQKIKESNPKIISARDITLKAYFPDTLFVEARVEIANVIEQSNEFYKKKEESKFSESELFDFTNINNWYKFEDIKIELFKKEK